MPNSGPSSIAPGRVAQEDLSPLALQMEFRQGMGSLRKEMSEGRKEMNEGLYKIQEGLSDLTAYLKEFLKDQKRRLSTTEEAKPVESKEAEAEGAAAKNTQTEKPDDAQQG
ncbi:uncharacterized protein LOC129585087 [Paramacrobiotus metropolitanus]|uniref:uncharacterized protein LOC129585087 n=1 Tax=Paramacrobiotus metropolitanus TaxID=2943436 RepID=UPI002445E20E|nr:uncharacterized protein LOC129585087 [Paramacrobiotus metropolitanus]